jgi:hypothetical protein
MHAQASASTICQIFSATPRGFLKLSPIKFKGTKAHPRASDPRTPGTKRFYSVDKILQELLSKSGRNWIPLGLGIAKL